MIGAAQIGEDGVRDVTTAVNIGSKSWPFDIRPRPWVFRPHIGLLPLSVTSPELLASNTLPNFSAVQPVRQLPEKNSHADRPPARPRWPQTDTTLRWRLLVAKAADQSDQVGDSRQSFPLHHTAVACRGVPATVHPVGSTDCRNKNST